MGKISFQLKPVVGFIVLALGICTTTAFAQVTDVNPDGNPALPRFGGRSLGLTIHPFNGDVVYVATEQGGFFVSPDGGTNWSHVDAIPIPLARDILFDPQDPSILIASGRYDGRVNNQGGIWVSNNGGATWFKPPTSNPACFTEASAWGIAIPNDPVAHSNIYVATDCGIAISNNSGETWTHVDPCTSANASFCGNRSTYYDVEARVVGGNVQLDVCGDEGYFRSTDGGATWSAPDPNSPARAGVGGAFNPCNVATAPGDSNTVYLANYSGVSGGFCVSRLMENAAGGAQGSWTDMQATSSNCRDPWVVSHPDLAGDPNRYQVYFGDTVILRTQRCNLANTPRCATGNASWPNTNAGSHSDTSDIAFDPTTPNGCPVLLSSDGGVAASTDCGATWADGNRGLHALDVVTFAGTQQPAGVVDLYAGTQDNGIYASLNNAANWTRPVGADGYNVMADRTPPVRVFHRACFGCSDSISNRGIVATGGFSDPPGNVPTFARAVQFGPQSYVFLTSDNSTPAQWTAWVTTNEGGAWTQLGPSPLPGGPGEIKAAGSTVAPTFFLRLIVGGLPQIFRLSGPLNNTATLTLANASLFFPTNAWDVDPNNPLRLYAVDSFRRSVMFSIDGGATWNPDPIITALVTRNGTFRFVSNTYGGLVRGIAFDPNSSAILLGTLNAGIFVSLTSGQSWFRVTDSDGISQAERFFFDSANDAMFAATRGRGIWKFTLPKPHIQVPGNLDFGPSCVGSTIFQTLNVCNTGVDNLVVDPITSSNTRFNITNPSSGYPVTISPDFCFPFQVEFDSAISGLATADLTIFSNDPNFPLVIVAAKANVGQPTAVTAVADTGNFGEVCADSAEIRDLPITVNNSGSCPLTIFGITSSSTEFELPDVLNFPMSVAPGDNIEIPIRFNPTSPGPKSSTLSISVNDPVTPSKIVTVTGTAPPEYVCEPPLFASIDAAIGPTFGTGTTGGYTFNGSGHVLKSFGPSNVFGVQAQGEYMFYPGRQEGQADTGLLYRRGPLQFAVSGSLKRVNLRSEASSGAVSHATLAMDVLLPSVRFGIFGSKGLRETDVVTLSETIGTATPSGQPVIENEHLLHTIDQLGGSVQFEIVSDVWVDGHIEWLHRHPPGVSDTAGGAARLSALVFPNVALTMQVDFNESFVGPNTVGTVTFGVTLGRWSRPKDYSNPVNPLGTLIPRVHYELFNRTR